MDVQEGGERDTGDEMGKKSEWRKDGKGKEGAYMEQIGVKEGEK